jgi:predicted phage terminase large subunit-like protein
VTVTTDTVFRARLPAARAEAGYRYVDTGAAWGPGFLAECLGFPRAAHDDQVDALSGAVQLAIEKGGRLNRAGGPLRILGVEGTGGRPD